MSNCCDHQHPDHTGQLKSLNRASGQLEGVKKMISERKYCPEIITQLRAARAAIKSVEAAILEKHLSGCVEEALELGNKKQVQKKISELVDIFKRFEG